MTRPIPDKESMIVEFKSDVDPIADSELAAAVVCLANAEGGNLYIGVEDDGTVTGLHTRHRSVTGVMAVIANRTHPSVSVRSEAIEVGGLLVARIEVPKSEAIVSTSDGLTQRRRLLADGRPECVPFYPYEFVQRQSDLRRVDYSALPVADATLADFDPIQRQRLRNLVERYRGDRTLLDLSDSELDGALGLVDGDGEKRAPTVAGLLMLGWERSLRKHLPTHEVAVQDLAGTQVRLNEFTRKPLVELFELVYEQYFAARVIEEELQLGLFRVPIPNYDRQAFREGLVNALVHRDYTRLGAVHVRWEAEGLVISNPGGFIEGVTLDNILVTTPRPRNPLLADVMKRVGLAERTGRGVDRIYEGLLRYGRPAPDYAQSDSSSVVLRLPKADADLPFLELIVEEEKRTDAPMPIDTLIALAQLRASTRVDVGTLSRSVQRDVAATRSLLSRLVEAGLVQIQGPARSREYSLSAAVYRRLGQASDYVRQAAFDDVQQEQMVLQFVQQHGRITRKDAAELCRISSDSAKRLLQRLTQEGKINAYGGGRSVYYARP